MSVFLLHIEDSEIDHELFLRGIRDIPVVWERTTADGFERLQSFKDGEHPALIIVDLNLPAENGIKLIHRIKTHPRFRNIPVIVLSSITEIKEIDDCYTAGANAFLQKTLRPQELIRKIEALKNFWLSSVTLPNIEERK